jgi:hypothetical protein
MRAGSISLPSALFRISSISFCWHVAPRSSNTSRFLRLPRSKNPVSTWVPFAAQHDQRATENAARWEHHDLTVAKTLGMQDLHDQLRDPFCFIITDHDLDFHVDRILKVFNTSVLFAHSLRMPGASNLENRHARQVFLCERFFDLIGFGALQYRFDFLYRSIPSQSFDSGLAPFSSTSLELDRPRWMAAAARLPF